MNNYCENCVNQKIPVSLKKKFNSEYSITFIECPTSDEKVVGCLIKERLDIDWNKFCSWLLDHKKLSASEAISMSKLGLLEVDKKGK